MNKDIKTIKECYELGNFKKTKEMIKKLDIKSLSDEEKKEINKLNKYLNIDKLSIAIGLFIFFIPIILLIIYAGN